MDTISQQKTLALNRLIGDDYLDARQLYLYQFGRLPNIQELFRIDSEKASETIRKQLADEIADVYQMQWRTAGNKTTYLDKSIMILHRRVMLSFDGSCCEILHDGQQPKRVEELVKLLFRHRQRQKRQPLEINLVVQTRSGVELRSMDIRRTRLDLDLYYEDDFKAVDETICNRLNRKNDKGIVLLHGLPGTGKTTYLRYLVGRLKKRVLFLSPSVAEHLVDPSFVQLLISHPNTVLIIEDAENILTDRRYGSGSAVSNLLNISDGLLADFLNVQLICTFNNALTLVDQALTRQGRLIARYEFGRLSVPKAQRLAKHLGLDTKIEAPATIAEIAHPNERTGKEQEKQVIGFRRAQEIMN